MADQTNNSQSADTNTAAPTGGESEFMALAPELGPNGLPINPPQGEEPGAVDHNLIMDTFFGEGQMEPPNQNSGGDQAQGPKPSGGQSDKGSLAPPTAAPTANGGEGSSQPEPSSLQQPDLQAPAGGPAPAQTPAPALAAAEGQPPAPQLSVEDRLALANVQALREQNEQLLARLAAFEKGGQPQPGAQPGTTQPGQQQEPPLRLAVPSDLYGAIMNTDDPATSQQAMGVLITAVAHNTINAVMAKVEPLIEAKLSGVTQTLEAQKAVQSMEEAYFERFPSHNNDLFKPLIQQVTAEKYKAFPHAKWDDIMMDAVGSTVNQRLNQLGIDPTGLQKLGDNGSDQGQGQSPANGNGAVPQRRPQPAPQLDVSNRGGGDKVSVDAGDFIAATFR